MRSWELGAGSWKQVPTVGNSWLVAKAALGVLPKF